MIKKVSQNIYKELSTAAVNWLLANVGDKIRIETTFAVETYAISTLANPFTFNQRDGRIGAGWVYDPQGQFTDFKIGDTVIVFSQVSGASTTWTIVDKADNYSIQLNADFSGIDGDVLEPGYVISVTVPITAVKYHYNFIENNNPDTFLSPIDGSEQILVHNAVDASNVTPLNMSFLGPLTYQEGSATIQGVSIDPGTTDGVYKSKFKVIHYTKVTPWILISQLENEQSDIPHIDFAALKCWKFISEIQAAYVYSDPNYIVSEIYSATLGNSGWYNENFNTAKTNYSIYSIVYKDADNNTIDSIGLTTGITSVSIVVKNTTNSPFSNNNTKFVLGFLKVPSVESEYLDTSKTADENFLFDRRLQTVGSAAVNGDQYGVADRQVLRDVVGTYNSTSQITITFNVSMLSAVVAALTASENPEYLLFLSIQNHTLATSVSDLVTLKVDMSEFYIVNTDDEMVTDMCTTFLRHPEGDVDTEGLNQCPTTGTHAIASSLANVLTSVSSGTIGYADDAIGTNYVPVITIGATLTNPITQVGLNTWVTAMTIPAGWVIQCIRVDANNFALGLATSVPDGADYNGKHLFTTVSFDSFSDGTFAGGVNEIPGETLDVYPEDEIVSATKFSIDRDGREDDEIILTSVQNNIIVKNSSTGESFDLERCTVNTSFYPKIGQVQYMNAQMARDFHVPSGTIRKYIHLYRRIDLDSGDLYVYQFNFPFLFRWEYWEKLIGANSDFFDTSLPNNGFNHLWFHYFSGDWGVYNQVIVNATKNGEAQQYISECEIVPHDYNSNAAYTTKNVKTYNEDGSTELYDSSNNRRLILYDADTLVKANFTKNVTPGGVTVEIKMEVWEQGGRYGIRVYSSRWVADSDTWFKSTDGSGKVVLTPSGNSIEAKCLIDFTLIPNVVSYKLSARIYDGAFGLLTDDSVQITTDDGTFITVD